MEYSYNIDDGMIIHDARAPGWFWINDAIMDEYACKIGMTALGVYLSLVRHADSHRECFPAHARIAASIGMQKRAVIRSIKTLENHGLIKVVHHFEGKRQTQNTYVILGIKGVSPETLPSVMEDTRGVSPETLERVSPETHKGIPIRKDTHRRKEPPISPKGDVEGFEQFWTAYPKKTAKGAALKSWLQLKPSVELTEHILHAVSQQRDSPQWQRDGGQFIPHPSTWLNQARWDDEPVRDVSNGVDMQAYRARIAAELAALEASDEAQ